LNRILVIRGGAIGDFILTLPALKVLRDRHPEAHIEILGYRHVAAVAECRFYAQAVRSIEYGPLSSFFAKESDLSPELANYFANFDLIVSYLYDPDKIFEANLRRCGARQIRSGPAKIGREAHAALQLARPIEELGLRIEDLGARIYPSPEDRQMARELLRNYKRPIVALHPGSGGENKNWPLECWIDIGNYLLSSEKFAGSLVVVSGEADEDQVRQLESIWNNSQVRFLKNLPLPQLAAVLANAIFLGHDSGISHLAAAAGARCILLFGPTDPAIWAPRNENVCVLRAPNGETSSLRYETVRDALRF
jgi:heptosyltransferase III